MTPISDESDPTERPDEIANESSRPFDRASFKRGRSPGKARLIWLLGAGLASLAIATGVLLLAETEPRNQAQPSTGLSPTPAPSKNGKGELEALPAGWTTLSKPPEVRSSAAIAWTGEQLLVWGGHVYEGFGEETAQRDGFAYDAGTDRWEELPPSPLDPRIAPAAAWTGQEMLIWGGEDDVGGFLGDGAAYNPSTGVWRMLAAPPIGARSPVSVWSGSELIVWGTKGRAEGDSSHGAAYNPNADVWRYIEPSPVDFERATTVWTGQERWFSAGVLGMETLASLPRLRVLPTTPGRMPGDDCRTPAFLPML